MGRSFYNNSRKPVSGHYKGYFLRDGKQKYVPHGKNLISQGPVPQHPCKGRQTDPKMVVRVSQKPRSSDKSMVMMSVKGQARNKSGSE